MITPEPKYENFKPKIEDIVKTAKSVMESTGKHPLSIIINKGKKSKGMIFTGVDKEKVKDLLRNLITKEKIEIYWLVAVSWIKTGNVFVRPSQDPNRKEALIISEYNGNTMETKRIFFMFERKEKKIIWGKRMTDTNFLNFADTWNFYKEDTMDESYNKMLIQKSLESFEEQWKKRKDKFIAKIREKYPDVTEEKVKNSIIKRITKGELLIDSKNNTV
ncbi:unnamed protein product, partial [marine sediment metagenome]